MESLGVQGAAPVRQDSPASGGDGEHPRETGLPSLRSGRGAPPVRQDSPESVPKEKGVSGQTESWSHQSC